MIKTFPFRIERNEEEKMKRVLEALENVVDRQENCGGKRIRVTGRTRDGLQILVVLDQSEDNIVFYYPMLGAVEKD